MAPSRAGASSFPASQTRRRTASSGPVAALLWPRPVRSSSSKNSPGPKRRDSPSVTVISHSPESVTANWRRGEGCQDPSQPGANRQNTAAVAEQGADRASGGLVGTKAVGALLGDLVKVRPA